MRGMAREGVAATDRCILYADIGTPLETSGRFILLFPESIWFIIYEYCSIYQMNIANFWLSAN